jgi:hypothetical protein
MGIEQRLGTKGWNRLVGTTRILIGATMISYGAMDAGIIKTPNIKILQQLIQPNSTSGYTAQRESLYDNIERNRKNKKSIGEKLFPNNKSMHSNGYNSGGMPPKEIIDAVDKTGNKIDNSVPYLIMIGGVLSLVSGAYYLVKHK